MATVKYTVVNGIILHENRAGIQHDYMPDSLGSTYALLDNTQTMTDAFTYWPYGEVRTNTGSTGTPFTFCGTVGYFFDLSSQMFYIRRRYLASPVTRWATVDPLWPNLPAYSYVWNKPVFLADPSGLVVCQDNSYG
jgi:RHS repeat-associated protein